MTVQKAPMLVNREITESRWRRVNTAFTIPSVKYPQLMSHLW